MPGAPYCPLCDKRMREILTPRGGMYTCLSAECMLSISVHDPAVGRWADAKMPPCPRCATPMRAFFRILDGFKKIQCPKCRKEGKLSQVMVGKVIDMPPQQQQNWSVDPGEL